MKNLTNKNLIIFGLLAAFVFSTAITPINASAHQTYTTQTGATFEPNEYVPPEYTPTFVSDNNNQTPVVINNNQSPTISTNPAPIIGSLIPVYSYKCSENKNITIVGKNFNSSSIAKWDGSARITTYVNSKNLVMELTTTDICNLGNHLITVDNGQSNGGLSNGVYFTINKTDKSTTSSVNLSANVLSSGFMPSNFFEWFILFLIILLIIILIRKMFFNKNKNITLQVLNLTATSVTLGATGLVQNSVYVFELVGAFGLNKVQVVATREGTANATFTNIAAASHYTATIKKHDPKTGLLTNIPNTPVLYFDTLK